MNNTVPSEYITHFAAQNSLEAARRVTARYLDRFTAWLGDRAITPAVLMDYRASLTVPSVRKGRPPSGDTLAMSTRNRHLTAVKSYLNWLRRRGHIALSRDQISEELAAYKVPTHEPDVFTRDEIKRLLDASMKAPPSLDRPVGAWLVLALTLGCRPGELAKISAASIMSDADEVLIYAGKTKRQRRVPLHDTKSATVLLLALSRNVLDIVGGMTHRTWSDLCVTAGIEHRPIKTLRATAIAYAASSGKIPEYLLAARFGHSQDVSIKYYRQPIQGVTGSTFEEWYGCQAAFAAVVADCLKQIRGERHG